MCSVRFRTKVLKQTPSSLPNGKAGRSAEEATEAGWREVLVVAVSKIVSLAARRTPQTGPVVGGVFESEVVPQGK